MKRSIRTDLAMEGATGGDLPGVTIDAWESGDIRVTQVTVTEGEGAKLLQKAPGTYITLESPGAREPQQRIALANLLGEELSRMLPPDNGRPTLVIGLGNRQVTPDAVGPKTIGETLVTRHLFRELPETVDQRMRPVCAVAPGVLGVTGVETLEMVLGLVREVRPRAVIVVDALAARASTRLGTAVQLTDTGIQPGSGVGNHRSALNQASLGVPVLAIGVPTVIYAATIVRDALESLLENGDENLLEGLTARLLETPMGEMIVTPREVDDMVDDIARILAGGINRALHPGLSEREIAVMRG